MKQWIIGSVATLGLAALATGCAMSSSAPVSGFLYTNASNATAATSNETGDKVGKSCASSILGWVGTGDASIAAAVKNGDIQTISSVSSENYGILGLYAENCTVVSGN